MYLAVLTTLAGLHFAIVAVYLITRKIDYPLWVYVEVALFAGGRRRFCSSSSMRRSDWRLVRRSGRSRGINSVWRV